MMNVNFFVKNGSSMVEFQGVEYERNGSETNAWREYEIFSNHDTKSFLVIKSKVSSKKYEVLAKVCEFKQALNICCDLEDMESEAKKLMITNKVKGLELYQKLRDKEWELRDKLATA